MLGVTGGQCYVNEGTNTAKGAATVAVYEA